MTREEAATVMQNCAFMLHNGTKHLKSEHVQQFHEAYETAIKALEQEPCDDCISRSEAIKVASGYCHPANVAKELEKLPFVTPERKWIPCSERLPDEGERVLATHLGGINPNSQVIEHIYQCGNFTRGWDMDMNVDSPTFGQRYMGKVIAWMPLPAPYREEGGE